MRVEGRVRNSMYVITSANGVVKEIPLSEARSDQKLQAAIKRNSWEEIPDGDK